MQNTVAVILAAGEGARMKSSIPKVLHTVCGKPMIKYLIETLNNIGVKNIIVVVGHKSEMVKDEIKGVQFVEQTKLLGTGDAVLRVQAAVDKYKNVGSVFITYGDTPLIKPKTLEAIVQRHDALKAGCTLLTARLKNPTGYGRIVRADNGRIIKIIEELDASIYDKVIEEINVGVYCFDKDILFSSLNKIKPDNRKNEYYLTDTIEVLAKSKVVIEAVSTDDHEEFLGVNTRKDLALAEQVLRNRILDSIIDKGVTVVDPANTYIYDGVEIARDTVIYPYTFIENNVKIGNSCSIGPFVRLRPGTVIEDNVRIGNFVEIVRSTVGSRTKIHHQCYIGDTVIGKDVNIGAGTIIANYDGRKKHKVLIEEKAFIGTGTILIAPVKVGKGAVTGAGSVVTKNKNVPDGKTVAGIPAKILKL